MNLRWAFDGQKRQAEQQEEARRRRERLQGREADSHLDRSLYSRCITRGVLGSILPTIYNNGNEIVQGPGVVVIRHEMIREARIVPLDGRPHVSNGIKSYMGDSRGVPRGELRDAQHSEHLAGG